MSDPHKSQLLLNNAPTDLKEIKPYVVGSTYNKETNTSIITIAFDVDIAVLNTTSRSVNMSALTSNIYQRLKKALSGVLRRGNVTKKYKAGTIRVRSVRNAGEVRNKENLVVIVDHVTGTTKDKDDNISKVGGKARYGALVAYIKWLKDEDQLAEITLHELGHNWYLPHNWEKDSPSGRVKRDENYMSYESGKRMEFSPKQLEKIHKNYYRLNKGGNTKKLAKDDFSFSSTTENKPYSSGNINDMIPLPIDH